MIHKTLGMKTDWKDNVIMMTGLDIGNDDFDLSIIQCLCGTKNFYSCEYISEVNILAELKLMKIFIA